MGAQARGGDPASALHRAGAPGRLAIPELDVRADRLLRVQGYVEPTRVRRPIREAAERAAALAADIACGEVAFRRVAVSGLDRGRLVLAGGHALHCPAFDRFLAGCPSVVVFVLTAGEAFDREVSRLMRDDEPVLALFLDAAGWMAVEAVTRRFADWLKAGIAVEGLRLTRRMGPGYRYPTAHPPGQTADPGAGARLGGSPAEWPLDEQAVLFRALGDGTPLPVELLESAAMRPGMSRSGLFGLRPAAVAGGRPARGMA